MAQKKRPKSAAEKLHERARKGLAEEKRKLRGRGILRAGFDREGAARVRLLKVQKREAAEAIKQSRRKKKKGKK